MGKVVRLGMRNLLKSGLEVAGLVLLVASTNNCAAQGMPLGPPPPFKPVVTVRGGGIDHYAPYRVPQRVVQGYVRDKNSAGIGRALVFLRDERTTQVRQMLADDNGNYLFGGLPLGHDYHVWVTIGTVETEKKFVSAAYGSHDVTMNFKLEGESVRPIVAPATSVLLKTPQVGTPTPPTAASSESTPAELHLSSLQRGMVHPRF
ncbi:carboxypeptidase-like regulatory domain-containing protein [Terriglobus sp. RCC_193]|uniref:carboxypeptidase-like regulatory domain-containing protein n=1 Tax=Terriglobus sp. RCC_193 TaxID=3239218 RepID=UPI00352558D4